MRRMSYCLVLPHGATPPHIVEKFPSHVEFSPRTDNHTLHDFHGHATNLRCNDAIICFSCLRLALWKSLGRGGISVVMIDCAPGKSVVFAKDTAIIKANLTRFPG
jgi:hypothetical protein